MEIYKIKEYLINNTDKVEELLHKYDFYKVKRYSKEFRFGFDTDEDCSVNRLKLHTLNYRNYKSDDSGDIITLIRKKTGLGFQDTIKNIAKFCGLFYSTNYIKIKLPFGGFYKNIEKIYNSEYASLENIPEATLDKYGRCQFTMFQNDGISLATQYKYGLGYDAENQRISIPIYNELGLVGVLGRYNAVEHDYKYLPLVKYPKSQILFGLIENYDHLTKSETILVAESEKSVMQCDSFDRHNIVAVGGSTISTFHKKQLHSLCPKNIIVCFDKGIYSKQAIDRLRMNLDECTKDNIDKVKQEIIIDKIKHLKLSNPYININIGYVWDSEGLLNDKESIFDRGKEIVDKFINNNVKWLDNEVKV